MRVHHAAHFRTVLANPAVCLIDTCIYSYEIHSRKFDRITLGIYSPVNVKVRLVFCVQAIICVSPVVCVEHPIRAVSILIDGVLGDSRSFIKNYQMNRLLVFLDPEADTSGAGYNLQQSLIAVGSGGFFGKGIGNATQSTSGFLPEAHTDFVFALLSETFGFAGALLLLVLFGILMLSTVRVAIKSDNLFLRLVCVGIVGMWMFQIFENIGMCIGLMPITGIPLPFISFGSSSMIAQCCAIGIVQSIWRCRTKSA